jgi:predicted transcriptional regulator
MSTTTAEILEALKGETAVSIAELAAKMGSPSYNVSSRVSKLHAYGQVERELVVGYRHKFRYRLPSKREAGR